MKTNKSRIAVATVTGMVLCFKLRTWELNALKMIFEAQQQSLL